MSKTLNTIITAVVTLILFIAVFFAGGFVGYHACEEDTEKIIEEKDQQIDDFFNLNQQLQAEAEYWKGFYDYCDENIEGALGQFVFDGLKELYDEEQ